MSQEAGAPRAETRALARLRLPGLGLPKAGSGPPIIPVLILVIVCLIGALAPWIAPHNPNSVDLANSLQPSVLNGGEWDHPLGTDHLGRDILSRFIDGARISLAVALAVVVGAGSIGIVLALVSGYFGGILDGLISRLTEVVIAVPFLLVAIAVVGAVGPGLFNLIAVLILMTWAGYARVLRVEVFRIRETEYVKLAKVAGCGWVRIIFSHILPNVMNPFIILATLQLGAIIIAEASLSYLGLGVPPPQATWGSMLADGKNYLSISREMTIVPAIAIAATCLSINILGNWLRVRLDPRFRQV